MQSNVTFVGTKENNIVVIPDEYGKTTLQCTTQQGGDYYTMPYDTVGVRMNSEDLFNLIQALVYRYNNIDAPDRCYQNVELKRYVHSSDAIKELVQKDTSDTLSY